MSAPSGQPFADGAVVTYSVLWSIQHEAWVYTGDRPHCAMAEPDGQCTSTVSVTDAEGVSTESCTREVGHTGPHVIHARPGLPILAWLVKR